MNDGFEEIEVRNNEGDRRFEADVDGQLAMLNYTRSGSNIALTHTEVPEALEGKGLGNKLAQAALEYARAERLKVQPLCSFVASYIRKNSEFQDLVEGK